MNVKKPQYNSSEYRKKHFLFRILQRELHVYSSFEENSRNRYLFCQKAIAAPSIVKMKHYKRQPLHINDMFPISEKKTLQIISKRRSEFFSSQNI